MLPASSYAADTLGASSKPIILESGLAYVEKKKKDGLLASVEQKVGQVPIHTCDKSNLPAHFLIYMHIYHQGDLVIVDYIAYLRDGESTAYRCKEFDGSGRF